LVTHHNNLKIIAEKIIYFVTSCITAAYREGNKIFLLLFFKGILLYLSPVF
jgi:hypothetical protein